MMSWIFEVKTTDEATSVRNLLGFWFRATDVTQSQFVAILQFFLGYALKE